ncbi:MAG: hypothetical protein JJT96_15580 [Opitutales bacterium]|nr:hypothetical protein [Opitutales bacterium]
MPSIFKKRHLLKTLQNVGRHPARLLDWLVIGVIGILLVWTTLRVGGYPVAGWPLFPAFILLAVCGALHAMARVSRVKSVGLHAWSWIPLPFLLWAWISVKWLSPLPSTGELHLLIWAGAYLLFLVTLHTVLTRVHQFTLFGVLGAVLVIAMAGAFREAYISPFWFPLGDRLRDDLIMAGHGGYLTIPSALSALILFSLPFCLFGALMPRFIGPVRMLLGFLIFASFFGLLVAGSMNAFYIAAGIFFFAPFFTLPLWKQRRRYFLALFGGLLVLGSLIWFTGSPLRDRFVEIHGNTRENLTAPFAGAAWRMFGDSPIIGHGAAAFSARWDYHGDPEVRWSPVHANHSWAEMAAELGLVGLLLSVTGILIMLGWTFRKWKATPYQAPSEEEAFRETNANRNRRRRRRKKERITRVPSQKILMGAVAFGIVALSVFAFFFSVLEIPVVVFFVAVALGVLGRVVRSDEWDLPKALRPRILMALLPVFLGSFILARGWPLLHAHKETFYAQERLARVLENPDQLFFEPTRLFRIMGEFESALGLRPDHAPAWGGLAWSHVNRIHVDDIPVASLAASALSAADRALAIDEKNGLFQFYRAVALGFATAPWEQVEAAFEEAVRLAPNRAQVLTTYAHFLHANGEPRERAIELLDRALAVDPTYRPASDLRARILL